MKAKININYVPMFSNKNMRNNTYNVNKIFENNIISIEFENRLIDFKLNEVEILNKGNYIEVQRNQAKRDGTWLGYCKENKGYLLEYEMPNGKRFKNLVKNPFNINKYTTKIK